MSLETLFEEFDLFAEAPDAVAKMRELVLRLAFSGGLSGTNTDDDSPASGWEQRTIESICSSLTPGFACSRSHQTEDGHVHLRTHNISTLGTLNFDLVVRIDPKMVDPLKSSLRSGDILFNNTNSQELVGKSALVDRDYDYGFSNHITRLRLADEAYPGFVVYYLTLLRNSGYFATLCTRWINQAAVNTETLKVQSIPLPPLAEQKRIVAKVDELLALCNRLEAQQQERETRHAALARASLARFADAPTPANLDFLFHEAYSIPPADLRKSILTLAVQGKLVGQDPSDESAELLLQRIEAERAELMRTKKLRRHEPLGPVPFDAIPFDIPPTWQWRYLADVCFLITDGAHHTPQYLESGVPFLSVKDVSSGAIDFSNTRHISEEAHRELCKRCNPEQGDILLTKVGTTGIAVTVDDDREFSIFVSLALLKFSQPNLDGRYLKHLINSPFVKQQSADNTQGIGNKNLVLRLINRFTVPIPPLAEQRRIAAKVDELFGLVEALEAQLAAAHSTASEFADAVIAELTQRRALTRRQNGCESRTTRARWPARPH